MSVDIEIVGHKDYESTEHYSITRNRKMKLAKSYILFFGDDLALLPESARQRDDFKRYRDLKNGIVHRVPRIGAIQRPLSPRELPDGWYFADDTKIRRFGNVIPKCVSSLENEVVLKNGEIVYPKKATRSPFMY